MPYHDLTNFEESHLLPHVITEWLERDFHGMPPFAQTAVRFCGELFKIFSQAQDPDISALGFWLREAHIYEMKMRFESLRGFRAPRGLVFHITASNVDTLFVYSWILSLLAGNGNIVRLPNKQSQALSNIIRTIEAVLENYEELHNHTLLLRYGHQSRITQAISRRADMRIVWGRNETIEAIRKIPLQPYAKEIVFPDRFSFCMVQTEAYLAAAREQKNLLAQAFFRDAYGFDQKGCSSPRLVLFLGDHAEACIPEFFDLLQKEIERRHYSLPLANFMEKYTLMHLHAAQLELSEAKVYSNELAAIRALSGKLSECKQPGGGLFYWNNIKDINELLRYVSVGDQTLTYFGFSEEEVDRIARILNGRGPSRIVPIGEALTFSEDWDGYSLFEELTKTISVKKHEME